MAFADNAVGQTYKQNFITGHVEDYAPFSETENLRFFDVRLGTASGPSPVHLFIFDSNPTTPYGQFYEPACSQSRRIEQLPHGDRSPGRMAPATSGGQHGSLENRDLP